MIAVLSCLKVNAQYFQFSQYNFSKARVNPATIATTRYASASILNRNQNTAGDFNIASNFFSAIYPLVNASTGKPWSGIGLTMMDDRSGNLFKNQEVTLSYAINVRLSKFRTLSVGFKGLYQSRSIGLDGLTTGLQYVQDRGFNTGASNGENFSQLQSSYATFSTGLYWHQVDKKDNVTGYWGISIFDINKPKDLSFKNVSQLESTLVLQGGFQAYKKNELSVFPELLLTSSYSSSLVNVGFRFQYELKPFSTQPSAKIDLLTKYIPGRSAILGVQLHQENLSVGVSYDFPAFISNSGNLGALEIGLEIRKLVNPKVKPKKKTSTNKKSAKAKPKKKSVAKKKIVDDKKPLVTKPPVKIEIPVTLPKTKEVAKDTLVAKLEETKQIEITVVGNRVDTTVVTLGAKAGALRQEPYAFEKITLQFQFEFNSVDLDDDTETFLKDLGKSLSEDKTLQVKIVGHTDNIGSVKFNEKLSLKRAESVKRFILKSGVDLSRLTTEGKGMSDPIVENDTEENRSKNRRVEILLFRK